MSDLPMHVHLMADAARLGALRRAVRAAVRPGDVVLDLGAGTGILGFFALQAGAARVYAIDRSPILNVARLLARENGFEDRIRFMDTDARRARLPERADLMVSDMVGRFGIDEGLAQTVVAARRLLVTPGGRSMPLGCEVWAAPVREPLLHRRYARGGSGLGLKLEAFHRLAANCPVGYDAPPRGLLAPWKRAYAFDFLRGPARPRRARLSFRLSGGPVHGLAIVTRLRLSGSVRTDSTRGTHWRPMFLPILEPVRARTVSAEIEFHDPLNLEWAVAGQRQSVLLASTPVLANLRREPI